MEILYNAAVLYEIPFQVAVYLICKTVPGNCLPEHICHGGHDGLVVEEVLLQAGPATAARLITS